MDKIAQILDKIPYVPNMELKLSIVGVIGLLIVFLLSLIFIGGSKMNRMTKQLIGSARKINAGGKVTEDNVDSVVKELEKLPEPAIKGWSRFMDKREDYPSDYLPVKEVLGDRKFSGKNTAGKVFFGLVGVACMAVIVYMCLIICSGDLHAVGIKDIVDQFGLVSSIICVLIVPLAFYAIFLLSLTLIYGKQQDRMFMAYSSLMDALDEQVVVYASDEEEFVSENLEEISQKVEDIVNDRLLNKDIIEVVTAPKMDEAEMDEKEEPVLAATSEPEPVEEAAASEVAEPEAAVPMTKEEEQRYLTALAVIVDEALNDSETTKEDFEKIAVLISDAKDNTFKNPADQEILESCLEAIANKYFR